MSVPLEESDGPQQPETSIDIDDKRALEQFFQDFDNGEDDGEAYLVGHKAGDFMNARPFDETIEELRLMLPTWRENNKDNPDFLFKLDLLEVAFFGSDP